MFRIWYFSVQEDKIIKRDRPFSLWVGNPFKSMDRHAHISIQPEQLLGTISPHFCKEG